MDRSNAGFVEKWRTAGAELEAIQRQELRDVDVARAIEILSEAFWIALRQNPPRATSGLVEQQKWFMKGLGR